MSDTPLDHTPPRPFPHTHYVGLPVPADFARVIVEAAEKNGVLFHDQLLTWAQAGAECARLHQARQTGRKKRK